MKRLAVVLHRDISEPTGRNEKILSRLELFREKGWQTDIYYVKEMETGNDIFRIFSVLLQAVQLVVSIKRSYNKNDKYVIWTMNNPPFLHVPGILLKIMSKDIKWVAEFRDAMCEEPFFSQKPIFTRILNRLLEEPIVKYADKVVTIKGSQGSIKYLEKKYSKVKKKYEEIPFHGYKKEDFENIRVKNFDKFTITYAGKFYKDWIDPKVFLKGFAQFIKEETISFEQIEVKLYCKGWWGSWLSEYDELIERLNLNDYVSVENFVPKEEIHAIMMGSDLLLYIHGADGSRTDMIHSKFYDYVGSGTPILFMGKKDTEIAQLIEEHGLGVVTDEKSVKEVKDCLTKLFKNKTQKNIKEDVKLMFVRDNNEREFLKIVEDVKEN